MITRIGMAPRRDGLSTTEFLDHWRTTHAEAASRIPHLRAYVQLHPVLVDGRRPLPYPGFDACSLIDFDSLDTVAEAFASPTYGGVVRADEERFIDVSRHSLVVSECDVRSPLAETGVVLATFLRRHPEASDDEFRTDVQAWADAPGGWGLELYVAIAPRPGGRPNAADALALRGFDTPSDAIGWSTSDDGGGAADHRLAGRVFGTAAFVARRHRVV